MFLWFGLGIMLICLGICLGWLTWATSCLVVWDVMMMIVGAFCFGIGDVVDGLRLLCWC